MGNFSFAKSALHAVRPDIVMFARHVKHFALERDRDGSRHENYPTAPERNIHKIHRRLAQMAARVCLHVEHGSTIGGRGLAGLARSWHTEVKRASSII